jgi:hypothetical protein
MKKPVSRPFIVELAGLEPATSWVRFTREASSPFATARRLCQPSGFAAAQHAVLRHASSWLLDQNLTNDRIGASAGHSRSMTDTSAPKRYTGPVCGYPNLIARPRSDGGGSYEICWSRGFEIRCHGRYVKHMRDCKDFYGSDGTRTRDRRRDRPVLALAGCAGIGGDYRRDQVFRLWACGDRRAPAGASGGLLRDERGMLRCLCRKRTGFAGMRSWFSARPPAANCFERRHARRMP